MDECTRSVSRKILGSANRLAIHSLSNYGHIWRFAIFFVATHGQFRPEDGNAFVKAAAATIAMGVVVELEQALIGRGHCRVRDLIPDAVGACLGALLVVLWREYLAIPNRPLAGSRHVREATRQSPRQQTWAGVTLA